MTAYTFKWLKAESGTDRTDRSASVSSVSAIALHAGENSSRASTQSMANPDCGGGGGDGISAHTLENQAAKTDESSHPAHPATANALWHAYRRRGFTLLRDGDGLDVRPADRLTELDVAELAAHKAALLALRTCPVLACGQLLPWCETAAHTCRDALQDSPTRAAVERREEAA